MNFFNSKSYFYGVNLCVVCLVMVCAFLLMHIYNYRQNNLHLTYQRDLEINSNLRIIQSINDYNGKGTKMHNMNDNEILHKPYHMMENQSNTTTDSGMNATTMQPINASIENQTNTVTMNPRINATHINGTLMEPVNVNYSRNIYFTIKTTHKHYTDRLFPLMLTWLQAVDKNKVR